MKQFLEKNKDMIGILIFITGMMWIQINNESKNYIRIQDLENRVIFLEWKLSSVSDFEFNLNSL